MIRLPKGVYDRQRKCACDSINCKICRNRMYKERSIKNARKNTPFNQDEIDGVYVDPRDTFDDIDIAKVEAFWNRVKSR